jgi:hypothetical protein
MEEQNSRRKFDNAERDTNSPFAHSSCFFWLLMLGLLLVRGCAWREWPSATTRARLRAKNKERLEAGVEKPWQLEGARVGGPRKKVTFDPNLPAEEELKPRQERKPRKGGDPAEAGSAPGKDPSGLVNLHHLQGPKGAKDRWPANGWARISPIEGEGYEPARLGLILDRMAVTTQKSYSSQFRLWELYCLRQQVSSMRFIDKYDKAEEDMMLDFIILSGLNLLRAPGTVKMRLAAVRNRHLSLGFLDPLAHMPRVPLAMAGLKNGTGPRSGGTRLPLRCFVGSGST